jgi:23S rRNA (adenine2503-C2)-methyltransferase
MSGKNPLFGMNIEKLTQVCEKLGLPSYAPSQVASWLYKKDIRRIEEMTNLSLEAREFLGEGYTVGGTEPVDVRQSADGTLKYLFAHPGEPGGDAVYVETAFIPEASRSTLCVSTQAGCARACRFCMTGLQGLQRNLTAGEILTQYARIPEKNSVTNIVYMGMGEPLDNLDGVMESLDLLTSSAGYGMSPRRITVSTVGISPQFETLFNGTRCNIAVSLHSPRPDERARIMPVEKSHPVNEVLSFLKATRPRSNRRISFEYILFNGLNDTIAHAREVVRLLHGIRCRVNLILYNGGPESGFSASSLDAAAAFQRTLNAKGVTATIRKSRGGDIDAACGLLSTKRLQTQ